MLEYSKLHGVRSAEHSVLGIPAQAKRGKARHLMSPTSCDWPKRHPWRRQVGREGQMPPSTHPWTGYHTVEASPPQVAWQGTLSLLPQITSLRHAEAYAIRNPCAPFLWNSSEGVPPTPLSAFGYKLRQKYGEYTQKSITQTGACSKNGSRQYACTLQNPCPPRTYTIHTAIVFSYTSTLRG